MVDGSLVSGGRSRRVNGERVSENESTSESSPRIPIGPAIRDRRQKLRMTLKGLAEATGLSVPFLSQIERDKALPSLVSLSSIGEALGVDASYFLGTPPPGQIVRRANAPEMLDIGDSAVKLIRLSGRHEERKLEAILVIAPANHSSPMVHRQGEGFWYLLSGKLEVWVGNEHFTLSPGDSAHFDQRHSYKMSNSGSEDAEFLWVGTPSIF